MANNNSNNQQRNGDEVRFEIKERIGVLGSKENGWTKEVNIVAWNGGAGKVDVREWDPGHTRMSRGITLFEEEAEKLTRALAERYNIDIGEEAAPACAQAAQETQAAEVALA